MKSIIFATATTLIASGAYAQDAYITQMGSNNAAANYSEYTQGPVDNLQVISQSGDNLQSANFTHGSASTAMNYQINTGNPSGSSMNSLIYQNAAGGGNGSGDNTAVAVQDNTGFGGNNRTFTSQIIQEGTGNVGVNWSQTSATAMANQSIGSIGTPGITINPAASSVPMPVLSTTTLPFGSTISIP